MKYLFLSTVINGGAPAAATAAPAASGVAAGGFLGSTTGIIFYFVFLFILFYFIGIRPNKKRQKKLEDLQSSISAGDWVLLDSGLYGKVTEIKDQVFMVEFGTNKSVIIPVVRHRLVDKVDPSLLSF